MLSINRTGVAALALALLVLGSTDRTCFAAKRPVFHRAVFERQCHHRPIAVGRKMGNSSPNLFSTQQNNENLNIKGKIHRPWQTRYKNLPNLPGRGGQNIAIEHLNLVNNRRIP